MHRKRRHYFRPDNAPLVVIDFYQRPHPPGRADAVTAKPNRLFLALAVGKIHPHLLRVPGPQRKNVTHLDRFCLNYLTLTTLGAFIPLAALKNFLVGSPVAAVAIKNRVLAAR